MVLRSKFSEVVIPDISFSEYIFRALRQHGDRTAIIEAVTGRKVTFSQIADQAVRCASALCRNGLHKGDMLGICASNSPEYFIVILAAASCGATITTCNPLYTADEMKRQLDDSRPKMIFAVPSVYEKVQDIGKLVPSIKKIFTIGEKSGAMSLANLTAREDGSNFPRNVCIDPKEDMLFLPYSSGTTGLPKGVMLTHRNFISTLSIFKNLPLHLTDCQYSVAPTFHMLGLMVGFMCLDQGICHVLDSRFSLERLFSCIEKYKVTQFSGVPSILLAMAKSPLLEKYDLTSLRTVGSGAAPLAPEVAELLKTKLGVIVSQGWGLSEIVPITVTDWPTTMPIANVGRVAPNTIMKVIDVETGKELGPYQTGEFCAKGPQIMKGYFRNPSATRNTIDEDGWLYTGDVGYYDENELIYIIDRKKELIKYKGFQVAPAELEAILVSHPRILDAAVIGIPDAEAGEVAKGYVVPKDKSLTKKEINNFLAEKVSKYKHLHGGIEFRTHIERTASGKILRGFYRNEIARKSKL